MTDKRWNLYLEKSRAIARLHRDVKTSFENANLSDWRERLNACRTASAVRKLMVAFETEDRANDRI